MKVLFNTVTSKFTPYPRADDEPVLGLDPVFDVYDLTVVSPPEFDETTHTLQEVNTPNHESKILTRTWVVVPLGFTSQLAVRRKQMAEILDGLSVADRSYFLMSRIKAEHAFDQGDIALAMYIVANQELPPDRPDLEAAKAAILALFPQS